MKPPPLPARRPAPPVPATDDRESLWHVAIAPDDIKVLTLDKLDDLFRLDVIDETTKIWRPGMAAWQPLGVVAGIEPTPPEPAQVQGPPPSTARRGPPPPPPRAPARRNMDSDHPTPVASNMSSTMPLGAPMSLGDTMPLGALDDSSPHLVTRTEVQAPPAAMLAASRPTAPPWMPEAREPELFNESPYAAPRARETGRAQRLTLALSVVAGLLVTLYRNDVLLDAARSSGHQGEYMKIETALGGPGFGTPRSIEKLSVTAEQTPAK